MITFSTVAREVFTVVLQDFVSQMVLLVADSDLSSHRRTFTPSPAFPSDLPPAFVAFVPWAIETV